MTHFQKLMELASEEFEIVIDENGQVMATQPQKAPGIAIPLTGSLGVREKLRLRFVERHGGKSPRSEALTQVIAWIESSARERNQGRQTIFTRVGRSAIDRSVWVDLGGSPSRFVRIDSEGWLLRTSTPTDVLFRRTDNSVVLPDPELLAAPDVPSLLHQVINVRSEDIELLAATIASGFVFDMPHPIVAFDGPHGSAKTFASRVVTQLIDPSSGHQRVPNNPQDLLAGARQGWVYALDNVTFIKPWLANDLCGLVTGYRSDTRRLYTNDELHSVTLRRIVILSSTQYAGIARPDLVERTVFFETPPIMESDRRAEEDVLREFQAIKPRLLGGLFDLVAAGLRGSMREEVKALSLPRMADFGRFVAGIDAELNSMLLPTYQQKLRSNVENALRVDLVGDALMRFISEQNADGSPFEGWSGSPTDLYAGLTSQSRWATFGNRLPNEWPGSAAVMMSHLNGIEPSLRANGIELVSDRDSRGRRVTIRPSR